MGSVSTYIHRQRAVIVTTLVDVNRHSSIFKMATILKEWTKEEVRSVTYMGKNFRLLEFIVS
jgi:hypothetical protein